MPLIELLKIKWTIHGLDAPGFAWIAAGGLVVGTLLILGWLLGIIFWESRIHRKAAKRLQALRTEYAAGPRQGLSGPAYDALVQVFEQVPSLKPAWRNFNSQILARRDNTGEEQFWASESAKAAFSNTAIIEPRLNRSFYIAVPGIVTGAGLLFTFLAILVALLDVRLENNTSAGARAVDSRVIRKIHFFGCRALFCDILSCVRETSTAPSHQKPETSCVCY